VIMKPAARLNEFGQSAWLDLIGRKLIRSGELKRMIEEDGVRGSRANPAIFEKAIVESDEYDDELTALIEQGKPAMEIYETIAVEDVQAACDVFRPLFDRLGGGDGFVSLEVSPYIARDTKATVAEAKRFWRAVESSERVDQDPGEPRKASRRSGRRPQPHQRQHHADLQRPRVRAGDRRLHVRAGRARRQRSAHLADPQRGELLRPAGWTRRWTSCSRRRAPGSAGQDRHRQREGGRTSAFSRASRRPRWKTLEAKGATRQRPLWASTGTKNKAYRDVMYVETLIGRDTVNTLPLATLQAFNDHGKVEGETILQGVEEARAQLARLREIGIDLEVVCAKLTDEGLDLFSKALDGAPARDLRAGSCAELLPQGAVAREPGPPQGRRGGRPEDRAREKVGARLWAGDATLWGAKNVAKTRLGWLEATRFGQQHAAEIAGFAKEAAQKFRHCLLLGMAGPRSPPT